MSNESILIDNITILLAREYPSPSGIKTRIEAKMWLEAIESFESRLVLAGVISETDWFNAPKVMTFNRLESTQGVMQVGHLVQAKLMLEQLIVNSCSLEEKEKLNFPFREIMASLCRFKSLLCEDPSTKRLFMTIYSSLESKEQGDYPAIAMVPKKESMRKDWYKYYGFYKVILGLVNFESPAIDNIKFNLDWMKDDDAILILLFSYAIASDQIESQFPKILNQSKKMLRETPSLKPIHNAMSVLLD